MDGIMCALCDRAILSADRAIFLGIGRLLLHSACDDEALDGFTDDVPRGRRLEDLVHAEREAQSR